VIAANIAMPAERSREELLAALTPMLGDADPTVRDDAAYPILATWIVRGEFDGMLAGDDIVAMFADARTQARTFAALILAAILRRDANTGELTSDEVRGWRERFGSWWVAEKELRGYDDRIGWLHAVAHGADAVRAFARSPRMSADDLATLLRLAAERLLVPTDYRFAQFEDDRLAYALAAALCRPELTDAVGWLEPLHAAIGAGEPGPTPTWAANTINTLTSLHVYVQRGVRFYDPVTAEAGPVAIPTAAEAILDRIADVLRLPAYWLA
jgi:Protein of unknown function (DUF2785)